LNQDAFGLLARYLLHLRRRRLGARGCLLLVDRFGRGVMPTFGDRNSEWPVSGARGEAAQGLQGVGR
jgi:hypothetical protein